MAVIIREYEGQSCVFADKSATDDMLDAMQQLMTGDPVYFDPEYRDSLQMCWDKIHPDLRQSQV
jgi:hypothetical protein